jgi:uncharacterized membrane protein
MRSVARWLSARFLEGFFILLPLLIAYLMLGQLFDLLLALTQPVVDVLPTRLFSEEAAHRLTAAAVLVAIFVVVGMLAGTALARRFGSWVERSLLERFPPYSVVKSLTTRIAGKDVPAKLQPALLSVAPDTRMLVAVVDALPDGNLTVFLPLAPTPGVGVLQIVPAAKVERLESSMTEALGWLFNWGVDTEALLKPRSATRQEPH